MAELVGSTPRIQEGIRKLRDSLARGEEIGRVIAQVDPFDFDRREPRWQERREEYEKLVQMFGEPDPEHMVLPLDREREQHGN